ncbi:MAG: DUF1905 domain-containing protein [Bacteroidota bacterium]
MEYKFKSILEKFQRNKVWSFHFKIPESIALEILKNTKRVICTINHETTYQCGLLSAGELGYFINVNAIIRKKAGLSLHDDAQLSIRSDSSKYGLPVPEVFQEFLKQDVVFERYFHSLPKGKQRSLIHKIGTYKSEHKQLEKTMIIRDYLIQVEGNLDFKELQEAFKKNRYN